MRILITGFEPFGHNETNVSWEVAQMLANRLPDTMDVSSLLLPVSYIRAWQTLHDELNRQRYDMLVMLGLAQSRTDICFERVAINLADASQADNDGEIRHDAGIIEQGPVAYFSTLPIRRMCEAVKQKGIPAKISNSAGTHVCNSVFYRAMHWASTAEKPPQVGFVHLPGSNENLGAESMCQAMRLAIASALERK